MHQDINATTPDPRVGQSWVGGGRSWSRVPRTGVQGPGESPGELAGARKGGGCHRKGAPHRDTCSLHRQLSVGDTYLPAGLSPTGAASWRSGSHFATFLVMKPDTV